MALSPGIPFGAAVGSGFARLNFATTRAILDRAIDARPHPVEHSRCGGKVHLRQPQWHYIGPEIVPLERVATPKLFLGQQIEDAVLHFMTGL